MTYNVSIADTLRHAVALTFDLWPTDLEHL